MSFDFFPTEQDATLLNAARHPSLQPDAGVWSNFGGGAVTYGMRSLAEAGRAIDLAGAAVPVVVDAITGGTERQDNYFREHDDLFNNAVDYWTPRPGEVGAAGQIAGQLAGGVLQAAVSPALLVGSAQLGTAEDLVRQGVGAGAANLVGGIAGVSNAAGLRLPFLGKTLASRVLSGAVGNTVLGAATAGGERAVLNATGNERQAAEFDPADLRARVLDAMLGAAFGGLAHLHTPGEPTPKLTATDEAALLVANQQRHLEGTTAPGRPATETDLTQHVEAMREAIGQVLAGEPVSVDRTIEGMRMVPDEVQARERAAVGDEAARLAMEEAPPAAPLNSVEARVSLDERLAELIAKRDEAQATAGRAPTPYVVQETRQALAEHLSRVPEESPELLRQRAEEIRAMDPSTSDEAALAQAHKELAARVADHHMMAQRLQAVIDANARALEAAQLVPTLDQRITELQAQRGLMAQAIPETSIAPARPTPAPYSIERPTAATAESAEATSGDMTKARARAVLEQNPDLTVPTGTFDAQGNAEHVRVADVMAFTDAEAAQTRATAPELFRTAASCLLGIL